MSKGCFGLITILGRIGREPVVHGQGERKCLSFPVAVTTGFGQYEKTSWYQVKFWGKDSRLDGVSSFTHKGARILVNGEPTVTEFDKRDGSRGMAIEVNATDLTGIDYPDSQPRTDQRKPHPPAPKPQQQDYDDDVPF